MKVYFTVITALVLIGTAVGSRLGEGEKRMLLARSCEDQKLYCCCEDVTDYCVSESFKDGSLEYSCRTSRYASDLSSNNKNSVEKLVEKGSDACTDPCVKLF
jgi:hypothetical protein